MLQTAVGCILVIVGMFIAFGLTRLAANAVIAFIAILACAAVGFQIYEQQWTGWTNILLRSLISGGVAGLLCLPVLPFSSFFRKKR